MKTKLFTVLTACTVSLASLTPLAQAFYDTNGNWAESSIDKLSQQGIITGYPDGQFKPNGLLTRAEFATVLTKAANLSNTATDGRSNFADVNPNFWAYRAIEQASDQGLISGYPGGYFYPNQKISRAEVLTVLSKAAKLPAMSNSEADTVLASYNDRDQVPTWARNSVAAAIKAGIFVPSNNQNTLEANRLASRADIAAFTDNMMAMMPEGVYHNASNQQTNTSTQQEATVAIVPANTTFTGILTTAITSERSQEGDNIAVTLERPLLASDGRVVAPAGSQLKGKITELEKAGRAEKNASVTLRFNKLVLTGGKTYNVAAAVNTKDGELDAGTAKERVVSVAGKTVAGAAIGTGAGAILGAIKGNGKVDDYLTRGAIIGASAGAVTAVAGKGKELILLPGDTLELRLSEALSINMQND